MPGACPRFSFVQIIVLLAALAAGAVSAAESADAQARDSIIKEPSIAARVLGGDNAQEGEWPSIVALVRFGNRSLSDRIFCGGTVVAKRWVMTAAHCLHTTAGQIERPSSMRVVAGITDLRDDNFVEEVIVTNIFIHPEYDNDINLPPNDVALLELATDVDAPVATLFTGDASLYTESLGYIVGWGATEFVDDVGTNLPSRLQDATVPLISEATCNLPESYGGIVTSKQICAGYVEGGIDTCSGDSGGPLFIIENGQIVQIGITSFGDGCGLPGKFGIYTDVAQSIPWLGNYISVPAQSDALITRFEARELGLIYEEEDDKFLGAFQPLSVLMLSMMLVLRRMSISGRLHSLRLKTSLCVATVMLLSTGCSVSSATTKDNLTNITMENAAVLELSEHAGRPGVGDITLGQDREVAIAALRQLPVLEARCEGKKTGLKGSGRAFIKEACLYEADTAQSPYYLAELALQSVTVQFLDERVVGLRIELAGASMTTLIDRINGQYQQLESAPRPFEWESEHNDAIRLMTSTSAEQEDLSNITLEFVDATIDGRLPAIFELKAP